MFKKFTNKINRKINNTVISACCAIENREAEMYLDTGVKALIAIVLGALVLALLYALFNTTIMPEVTEKVTSMFSYTA